MDSALVFLQTTRSIFVERNRKQEVAVRVPRPSQSPVKVQKLISYVGVRASGGSGQGSPISALKKQEQNQNGCERFAMTRAMRILGDDMFPWR